MDLDEYEDMTKAVTLADDPEPEPEVEAPLTISEALPDYDPEKHAEALALRFPDGVPPYRPCGEWILVQERSPRTKIGNIIITETQQQIDAQSEFLGRVLAVGEVSGWDKINNADLPGWPWYKPGHFVAMTRYSSNRHKDQGPEQPTYRLAHWNEILGVVTTVERVLR